MALFDDDESIFEVELGRVLRIPCKFIQGDSDAHPTLVKNLARQIQKTGKNFLPVIVELLGEDSYKAIQNTQILAAARQENLDFVWCIVVNEQMRDQILMESGELIQVSLLTASEEEIAEVLEYFKAQKSWRTINPKKAAQAIVKQREDHKINSLSFLTKQRCGIGKATAKKLKEAKIFLYEKE